MKKKTADRNEPVGKLTRVRDFLPQPSELVIPEETVKITIALNKSSVEFFKREATRRNTKYQRMIRELVDRYTAAHT